MMNFHNEDNLDNRFREFSIYFVSIGRDVILNYNEEAAGQKEKKGKWESVFENTVKALVKGMGGCVGCVYLGIRGAMLGSAVGGCVSTIVNHCFKPLFTGAHKSKAKEISKLVGYYKFGNKSSKNELTDVLINVAVEIFAHFEWQFIHIPVDCDWKHAMHKLALDAIARTMDYMNRVNKTSVENLTNLLIEGVLHGNSKQGYFSKFTPPPLQGLKVGGKLTPHPGKTILSKDDIFTSCDIWTKPGVIDGGKFYYSDKYDTLKFGYRLPFTFENVDDFPLEDQDYIHSSYEYRIKNDIAKYKNVILQEVESPEETMVNDITKILTEMFSEKFDELKSYLSSFLIPSPTLNEHYFGKFWPQRICLINSFVIRVHEQGKFIVDHIYERLNSSGELVITGCVGVGKTTVARWFSTHYENCFDYIFWVDCRKEDSLLACFISLAASIGITDIDKKLLPVITTEIYEKFQGRHCLFIFDGAADHATLRSVLPSKANSSKIICLITSRHDVWGQQSDYGMMECYKLPVFSDIEAMEFLTSEHAFGASSTSDVQELATTLHNHPLALRQAVAFIKRVKEMDPSYDIHKCLKEFESNPHALLYSCNLDDYSQSIYAAIKQTCKQIKKNPNSGKLAFIILSIVAYLDCEGIEFELFYSLDSYSETEILDALQLLKESSIINCPTRKTRFYVLTLFQLVIRIINKKYEINILKKALTCLDNSPSFSMKHLEKVFGYARIYPTLLCQFNLLREKLMTLNVCDEYSGFNGADIAHPCADEARELNCITYPDNEKF